MCGRFTLSSSKKVKDMFGIEVIPNFNIAHSQEVLVLNKEFVPQKMKWSYSPTWSKKPFNLINARSETLHLKPSFRNADRCIYIADGYFEWKRSSLKTPYFHYIENDLMYFGGLYNSLLGCCIVTRQSYENISHIHHRQPIILDKNDFQSWLSKEHDFSSPITEKIKFHKVSNIVNSPLNNNKDNLKKIN